MNRARTLTWKSWRFEATGLFPLALFCLLIMPGDPAQGGGPAPLPATAAQARQPAALAVSRDGSWLYAANRRSGSVSVVAAGLASVAAEHQVGRGLADLATLPDGKHLLAVDQADNALLLLEVHDRSVRLIERLEVAADPVSLVVAPDGRSCVLASLWSRRLTFVGLSSRSESNRNGLEIVRTVELPFNPRHLALAVDGAKLIAADAFGGKLAVVDVSHAVIESVRSLPGHNIRGLAVTADGQTLVVAHQSINRSARTNFEDVHWGVLLNSHLRSLRMDAVLSAGSDADLLRGGCSVSIGTSGNGAGDPAAMIPDGAGGMAIALSGVDEVTFVRTPTGHFRRHGVGSRPAALALRADGKAVYVANSLSDTVSEIEINSGKNVQTISLGTRPEPTLVERGERLFYDARLSHDGWMSCHTCHTDGHSNNQLADTLGDGTYGAPKRVPSLLGAGTTGPWSWTGSVTRLEDQVHKSVEKTMRGTALTDQQVEALTAYIRSLKAPLALAGPSEAVARGREVFRAQSCAECHAGSEYTSRGTYDVGVVDEAGNSRFNPPSLRGVSGRSSLLHDGRAATLDEVFTKHKHPGNAEMTPAEVTDLVVFLKSL